VSGKDTVKPFNWLTRPIESLPLSIAPTGLIGLERIYTLLGTTGTTNAQLQESLAKTEALYNEVATLGRERKG
jgi:hypothetical protein